MFSSEIHVGLDIGTSKVCMVVGETRSDGAIKILGISQVPSKGVVKGEIVDLKAVSECLRKVQNIAEEKNKVEINNVYITVTGGHIIGQNNRGVIRVLDNKVEISEEEIHEVKNNATDIDLPNDIGKVNSIIQYYNVDGQSNILDPLGMFCKKLEVDYHIVTGIKTRIQNSIRALHEFSFEVEGIVFSPLASSQIILDEQSKKEGSLLIDIGGGTTEYVCYVDGVLVASGCVALGGDNITSDISLVLKLPMNQAEKLKINHVNLSENKNNYDIHDNGVTLDDENIDIKLLNDIVECRVSEIFNLILEKLNKEKILFKIGSGIYLTGGSSLLRGISSQATKIFELPVVNPKLYDMPTNSKLFKNPQCSAAIGLIRYVQLINKTNKTGLFSKISQSIKSLFKKD